MPIKKIALNFESFYISSCELSKVLQKFPINISYFYMAQNLLIFYANILHLSVKRNNVIKVGIPQNNCERLISYFVEIFKDFIGKGHFSFSYIINLNLTGTYQSSDDKTN